jgi:hypothetical protein
MTSFPSALRSVLGGWTAADVASPPLLQRPWSLFKRAAHAARPDAELSRVIEDDVIPRLIVAHRVERADAPDGSVADSHLDWFITPTMLARRILLDGRDAHLALCEQLLGGGLSPEAIYIELLAPTATLMGEQWRKDELSFADATIGLGRLRMLIRELGWMTPYNGDNELTPRTVLFAPCPGEDVTFGFYLVEESYRWSGWRTTSEADATNEALAEAVKRHWFDRACLSLNRPQDAEQASLAIGLIRKASRNTDILIMVNGQALAGEPETLASLGARAANANGIAPLHIVDRAVIPPTKQ